MGGGQIPLWDNDFVEHSKIRGPDLTLGHGCIFREIINSVSKGLEKSQMNKGGDEDTKALRGWLVSAQPEGKPSLAFSRGLIFTSLPNTEPLAGCLGPRLSVCYSVPAGISTNPSCRRSSVCPETWSLFQELITAFKHSHSTALSSPDGGFSLPGTSSPLEFWWGTTSITHQGGSYIKAWGSSQQ